MGGPGGSSRSGWVKSRKQLSYPGNNPAQSPGLGFEWRGRGTPGSRQGSWVNPDTKEKWRSDLHHPPPIPPHWDYWDGKENRYRVYDDGYVETEQKRRKKK